MRPASFFLQNPTVLFRKILLRYGQILPDSFFLRLLFHEKLGYKLNLKNPKTYNEKLQWLKLHDRKPIYTVMVDKYEAKNYVANIIGNEFIIPTLGVWDRFDDIVFNKLPNQFVLKTTHDSGSVVICKDRESFDIDQAREILETSLKTDFYKLGREWPYKNVKRRIIAEKYMVDESGTELKDYKIFCFDGLPKIIQLDYDRFNNHKRNMYDTKWARLPFTLEFPTDWQRELEKPRNLDKMLEIASKLSIGHPHIRVDMYNIDGNIYFGELTFYHGSGFEKFVPEEWDYTLGSWIKLPYYRLAIPIR